MKYIATLEVKLYLEADNQSEIEEVLSNMDYAFNDPRGITDDDRMESKIESWEIKEAN